MPRASAAGSQAELVANACVLMGLVSLSIDTILRRWDSSP
jgi:hypothetical protein